MQLPRRLEECLNPSRRVPPLAHPSGHEEETAETVQTRPQNGTAPSSPNTGTQEQQSTSAAASSPIILHCGVHVGPSTTAVMGINQLIFDVFGTTVNGASRVLSVGCRSSESVSVIAATESVVSLAEGSQANQSHASSLSSHSLEAAFGPDSCKEAEDELQSPQQLPSPSSQTLPSLPTAEPVQNFYNWSNPFHIEAKGLGDVLVRVAPIATATPSQSMMTVMACEDLH